MSSLIVVHPLYDEIKDDWVIVRDTYAGEAQIKEKGQVYLPPTQSMILDGVNRSSTSVGAQMYAAYILRAVWHDLYKEAVEAYIGLLHQKPPTITVPDKIKDIRSNFGETPAQLLRRINEEQLVSGRLGLLVDLPRIPDPAKPLPYIAMYAAEAVRNWDTGEDASKQSILNYVILDESGYARNESNPFQWDAQTRYRVCTIGDIMNPVDGADYMTGLFTKTNAEGSLAFNPTAMLAPTIRGTTLKFIPFTFINTKDNLPTPDKAPLLGLANMMIAIYRGEADYRQNLFMQGQDTLVTIGGLLNRDPEKPEADLRTGAGARIDIEAGGDAKYIGVSGTGLPEQRSALQNDRSRAEVRAGQLVNARVGDKESGEALKTRLAAQTATLTAIALSGAAGLEKALKDAAVWSGANPDEVKVEPNLEFSSTLVTGQDMLQLLQAKDLGMPVSYESLHEYAVDRGLTKISFEEEMKRITKERTMIAVFKDPIAQANKEKELDNSDPANKPAPTAKPPAK
jgi:hypothetical protein